MDEILETDFVFNEELPLDEYPRPQLKRDSFINLNGKWDFKTFTDDNLFDNFIYIIIYRIANSTTYFFYLQIISATF